MYTPVIKDEKGQTIFQGTEHQTVKAAKDQVKRIWGELQVGESLTIKKC